MSTKVKRRSRVLVRKKTPTIEIIDNMIKQHEHHIQQLKELKKRYYMDLQQAINKI